MSGPFRTPDERFAGLPEFPFEPRYLELDGLRMARVDDGDASHYLQEDAGVRIGRRIAAWLADTA